MGSASRTSPTLLGQLGQDPTDQEAWALFVSRYGRRIYNWCRHWGLQDADTQDVTQNVLALLAQNMRTFHYDPGRSFRAWLRTLVQHAVSDFAKSRRRPGRGSGDSDVAAALQSVPARDDLMTRLSDEFDLELLEEAKARVRLRVEPQSWEAYRLTAEEGRSGVAAGERLGMKVAAVYKCRNRVEKMLQEEVGRLEGPAEERS
jgi:RNA polymerase sigma-70 factor (ECF subfamily)